MLTILYCYIKIHDNHTDSTAITVSIITPTVFIPTIRSVASVVSPSSEFSDPPWCHTPLAVPSSMDLHDLYRLLLPLLLPYCPFSADEPALFPTAGTKCTRLCTGLPHFCRKNDPACFRNRRGSLEVYLTHPQKWEKSGKKW